MGTSSEESILFVGGLESTVTDLTGGIDELEVDLFKSSSGGLGNEGLSEDQRSLLGTNAASLDHDVIVVDNTVVGEATQGGNALLSQISNGGGVSVATFVLDSDTDSVDFLVDFGSVVITVLTSSGDAVSNSSWMPASDTTDSSETSVGLSGQSLGSPSGGGTFESLTLGDTDDVEHFVLLEDLADSDFLFELGLGEIDFLGDVLTTVDLDFEDVSLLLSEVKVIKLGVSDDSDDLAVFLDSIQLSGDGLFVFPLLGVLGEGLLLGVDPVLVESSLELSGQVLSPDGGQSSETSGGFDVSDDTSNDDCGGFEDGDTFDDFLLVELGSWLLDFSENVCHTSLEDGESSQVDWLGFIVFREGTDSSSVVLGSLSWEETQGTVSRTFELSVRHSPDRKSVV